MNKALLAAVGASALLIGAPAAYMLKPSSDQRLQAVGSELSGDFLTGGATLGTGWSQGTGKLIGNNVIAKRAFKNSTAIVKGKTYRYQITTAGWTQGELSVGVGGALSPLTGTNRPVPNGTRGEYDITDNFPTNLGLRDQIVSEMPPIDNNPDPDGAFRFKTGVAKFGTFDPMLYFGLPGAGHLHMFLCNTGINAFSTYRSLRTSGGTACGDPKYPVNRSAYWAPAMIGGNNQAIVPFFSDVYYKQIPASNPVCQGVPGPSTVGICVNIPNGLKFVAGFNMANQASGVFSTNVNEQYAQTYSCRTPESLGASVSHPSAPGVYFSIDEAVDAGCPAGAVLFVKIEAPTCWNGTQIDSADHRSHMAYRRNEDGSVAMNWTHNGVAQPPANIGRCPSTHPYLIPHFTMQFFYKTDAAFAQKKWHLSSDEQMSPRMANGATIHMDYMEAWSPVVKDAWFEKCITEHRSCAGGVMGNGKIIPENRYNGGYAQISRYSAVPRNRYGWGPPMMGSGTFVGEITATESGQFWIYSPDGWTGEITAFSLKEVIKGRNIAPITTTGSIG